MHKTLLYNVIFLIAQYDLFIIFIFHNDIRKEIMIILRAQSND